MAWKSYVVSLARGKRELWRFCDIWNRVVAVLNENIYFLNLLASAFPRYSIKNTWRKKKTSQFFDLINDFSRSVVVCFGFRFESVSVLRVIKNAMCCFECFFDIVRAQRRRLTSVLMSSRMSLKIKSKFKWIESSDKCKKKHLKSSLNSIYCNKSLDEHSINPSTNQWSLLNKWKKVYVYDNLMRMRGFSHGTIEL